MNKCVPQGPNLTAGWMGDNGGAAFRSGVSQVGKKAQSMPLNILLLVLRGIAAVATATGVILFAAGVIRMLRIIAVGRPDHERWNKPLTRLTSAVYLTISGRTFKGRPVVAVAHWLVMVSFVILFLTLISAYGQLTDPLFSLPLLGDWQPWHWTVEVLAALSFIAIATLFVVRLAAGVRAKEEGKPRSSRFFGSTRWQAWFVEAVVALVGAAILAGDTFRYALELKVDPTAVQAGDYPLTWWIGAGLTGWSEQSLGLAIVITATFKIVVSMVWMTVVGANVAMGISWHRFLALFNIATGRNPKAKKPLGALPLPLIDGEPTPNLEEAIEALEEAAEEAAEEGAGDEEDEDLIHIGLGSTGDLTWKDRLDLLSCTECGRCQDMCPAWNTGKPLSPKLLTLAMRDNLVASAGALPPGQKQADSKDVLGALLEAGAIGEDGVSTKDTALVPNVLEPDVLWDCTMCGACVDQCPVDIEHVDRIANLRRFQVLMESAFPRELAKPFRAMETKGNPYNQAPRRRLDWAKNLDFEVPVLFETAEDATPFDYLFWVGCAGAYDEQAKKTSAAAAELLHTAGVTFAVLGSSESCTGDPARRAGNEILFQMLARDTIETLTEAKARRIVVTCAHCFNTMLNEYPELGGHFEVIHHTQLLNRLVKDGDLTPLPPSEEARQTITYHDPCFLGRYNQVYAPPRELLDAIPGVERVEMKQSKDLAMCCGAGGARAWMEETTGTRIASARLGQAEATGATTVATACPFCTQMLDSAVSKDTPSEVKDVAVLLLEGVRREREGIRPRQ